MKLTQIYFLVILLFFGVSYGTSAIVDYTRTIEQSISNSPQYKYINYRLNSSQMNPAIQFGQLLPSIDISGKIKKVQGSTNGLVQGIINLKQPLYNYKIYKSLQSEQQKLQAAQQDYYSNYQQFLYDVSYAYFSLAKAIKNVEYASYNLKTAEINLTELEHKFKAGVVNIADYQTSKTNFYIANADYIYAKQEEKIARGGLFKFTGNNDDVLLYNNEFKLKDPSLSLITKENLEELVMKANPLYLSAVHNKESKYYEYQSATSAFLPKVDFELKYSSGDNAIVSVFNNSLQSKGAAGAFYFGINLEWNFLSGGVNFAELKKAAYDYQSSEFNMIQINRIAQNDAIYFYRLVELNKNKIESLRKSLTSIQIAYQGYKERYSQGITTIIQYFMLLNQYYQRLIEINNAEFEYILGFLNLYKTAGILTTRTVQNFNEWILFNKNME